MNAHHTLSDLDLLDVCDALVKRAQQRGASQAEVYGERVSSVSASLEQGLLKGAQAAEHEAFGVRVFVGDRLGFASVNRRDPKALDEAIDDAIAIAKAAAGDAGNDLADPLPVRPIGGLNDARIASATVDDAVDLAVKMLAAAKKADRRASVDSGSASLSSGQTAIANSRGLRVSDVDSAVQWGLFGMAIDGKEVSSFDHAYDAVRSLDDVDVAATGRLFAERVTALLRPKTTKAYVGPALFSAEAFEEIFLATLLGAVDGDTVLKGRSRLSALRGQRVASSGLTIVDDGTLSGAIGSATFDREGRAHKRTVIVGDGVLHRFLYDVRAAKRAGVAPTGHAQGSARSLPSIGTTNIVVGGGAFSEDDLLSQLGTGLLVNRFSGNVDEVSGDFSGVAKGSFMVKGGKRRGPVKETLIAGNVFDLLNKVTALGSTQHRLIATLCPTVLIDGVTVTAGADDVE
jgi:PmbA protein